MAKRHNTDDEPRLEQFEKVVSKMTNPFPEFKKTAEVVDHVLLLHSIKMVESSFGQTFYIRCYDETLERNIIVTGSSVALLSQIDGVDEVEGMRIVIRNRGKSYLIELAEAI